LRGCGEQEFVLRSAWATQSQAPEPQDALEMREQHLNLFLTAAGDLKFGCRGKGPRHITGIFVDIARDLPRLLRVNLGESSAS
jgi:hypothetical protein